MGARGATDCPHTLQVKGMSNTEKQSKKWHSEKMNYLPEAEVHRSQGDNEGLKSQLSDTASM